MKIKHWQGYGCVNAKKIGTYDDHITIKVVGNHEYGLDRSDDKYDVFNWLVKKFDKKHKDYTDIDEIVFNYTEDEIVDGVRNDAAIYMIYFK